MNHTGNPVFRQYTCAHPKTINIFLPIVAERTSPSLSSLHSFESGSEFFDHMAAAAAVLCFTEISALLSFTSKLK